MIDPLKIGLDRNINDPGLFLEGFIIMKSWEHNGALHLPINLIFSESGIFHDMPIYPITSQI